MNTYVASRRSKLKTQKSKSNDTQFNLIQMQFRLNSQFTTPLVKEREVETSRSWELSKERQPHSLHPLKADRSPAYFMSGIGRFPKATLALNIPQNRATADPNKNARSKPGAFNGV
ncbi:hypothetical protein [Devosia sp. WQ 349K1]|uniref:hypothetical protein n=1 Tax=Devosia sp. WQ 349K1 TaxID=2800329 RepID=UPI00190847D7|nr:hypothetical protein [Devosia sp. WQ 349K1]